MAFDIDVSPPVDPSGFTNGLGGPNQGGHTGPNWYIQYGMDIGGAEGTQVFAAFDAHVTKYQPHDPNADSGKVFGAQLFMRAPNERMGGFFTHITDVPDGIGVDAVVSRGDLLGTIFPFAGIPPHAHIALVEIIGGAPGGQYQGIDLYQFFLGLEGTSSDTVVPVTFNEDGSPPVPQQ